MNKMKRFLDGKEEFEEDTNVSKKMNDALTKQSSSQDVIGQEISQTIKDAMFCVAAEHIDDPVLSLLNKTDHENHLRATPAVKHKVHKKTRVGDYTCDILVVLFGLYKKYNKEKQAPRQAKELAELIVAKLSHLESVDKFECAPNGYINIFVKEGLKKEENQQSM